jgi:hypothetical protein
MAGIMQEMQILKVVVALGVPGLAIGVFFLLLHRFKWKLPAVPRNWVGPILVLFILSIVGVVALALFLWSPSVPRNWVGPILVLFILSIVGVVALALFLWSPLTKNSMQASLATPQGLNGPTTGRAEARPNRHEIDVRQYLSSDIEVESVEYISFSGSTFLDALVRGRKSISEGTSIEEMQYYAIIGFIASKSKWVKIFESTHYSDEAMEIFPFDLSRPAIHCLLFASSSGSGCYLDYEVLGIVNGELKFLLKREGIFQGSVEAQTDVVTEHMGGQATSFRWNGKTFEGVSLETEPHAPLPVDAVVVKYDIADDHKVTLSDDAVTLGPGQTLRLLRTNRGVTDRVLYSANGVIDSDAHGGWTATTNGTTDITVIPDGYDWDNAKKLTVNVKK